MMFIYVKIKNVIDNNGLEIEIFLGDEKNNLFSDESGIILTIYNSSQDILKSDKTIKLNPETKSDIVISRFFNEICLICLILVMKKKK